MHLNITAQCARDKVDDKSQPVGGIVEKQKRRCPLLQVPQHQGKRGQQRRQHACIQAVHRAHQHDKSQPKIDHAELRLCSGHLHKQFRHQPGRCNFCRSQKPAAGAQGIPYPPEQVPFRGACLLPASVQLRHVIQKSIPGEPPITLAQQAVIGRVIHRGILPITDLQAGAKLLQFFAQMAVVHIEHHGHGKLLPFGSPSVINTGHQLCQILAAEGIQRALCLFIKAKLACLHLFKQRCKALSAACTVRSVEIRHVQHFDLHLTGHCVVTAKLLRSFGHDGLARLGGNDTFRPGQIQYADRALTVDLQHMAQPFQLTDLLIVRDQVLRKIHDAVKLVGIRQLRQQSLVVQRNRL